MKTDLIALLNIALKGQLTCINQCFLHARILKHQGEIARADEEYKESIEAMKHADMLVERILALAAMPNLQELDQLMVGQSLDEMTQNDLAQKEKARAQLQAALAASDPATAQIIEHILANVEAHIGYLHTQGNHVNLKLENLELANLES